LNIKRLSELIKIELGSIDFVNFNIENDVFEHVIIVPKNGKKHIKIKIANVRDHSTLWIRETIFDLVGE
jgi:hypothetical protein